MCRSPQHWCWWPPLWLACWAAGAATALASRAVQTPASSTPSNSATKASPTPRLGSPLLRMQVERLRLNPAAPLRRPKREAAHLIYLRG